MNLKNAIEWLRLNNLPDIVVGVDSDRQAPTFSFEVDGKEEGDIEASISFFEQNVKLLPPGRYRIVAKKNKQAGAGKRMFRFTIEEEQAIQGTGMPSIGEIEHQVEKQVQAYISGYEKERKILDLEKELDLMKDALKEKNSWQSQLAFLGEHVAGHLVKKMGFKLPAPAEMEPTQIPRPQPQMEAIEGHPEGEGVESSELDDRHEAAIGCLCEKVDTEGAVDLVEKLSKLSPEALRKIQELDPAILEKVAQVDDSILAMVQNL